MCPLLPDRVNLREKVLPSRVLRAGGTKEHLPHVSAGKLLVFMSPCKRKRNKKNDGASIFFALLMPGFLLKVEFFRLQVFTSFYDSRLDFLATTFENELLDCC